jgi:hypothetical protein
MSSAYLANELDKLNVAEGPPSNHAFEKAFVDYQTMRGPQAKASIKEAQFLYWTGSLATPFAAFLQGHVIRKISTEAMLVGFAQGATGAVSLKRVSLPSRRGTIPWNHEIALKPEARSAISTAFWVGLLFLTVAIHYHSVENTGPVLSQETDTGAVSQFYQKFVLFGLDGSSTKELHFNMSVTAVVLWMCIESYRLFIPKSLSR